MTQAQEGTQQTEPMSDRERWIALYVLCAGMLMIVLDITVVNVALPSIKDDLGFNQSSLAWVVNAYLITFGGLLLLAGRLGDLLGRRRIFLTGLAVFVAASLLCGASQSEGLLIGGVITQLISWHWIFFVNAPIGHATAIWARRLLEDDKGIGIREGADLLGAVLITASLMVGVYTIVEPAAKDGWGASTTLLLGAGSLLLGALFVAREATAKTPLIPLRIFRSRNVSGANMVQILTVAGMFGMFFMGSLYLQLVQGYDALQIGLAFLPICIIMGVLTGRYSEPLIMRFGARTLLFPVLVLMGTGIGVCFPALMTIAMSGATRADAGLASGLVNTSAQVGGAVGLAVLATLSTSRTNALEDAGHSTASALTSGYHLAFWIAAGLVIAAIAIAAVVIQPEAKAAEQFAGDEMDQMPAADETALTEAA